MARGFIAFLFVLLLPFRLHALASWPKKTRGEAIVHGGGERPAGSPNHSARTGGHLSHRLPDRRLEVRTSPVRPSRHSTPEERKAARQGHKVQHIRLLNRNGFWWLMGCVICLVGVGVVSMEVNEKMRKDELCATPELVGERRSPISSTPRTIAGCPKDKLEKDPWAAVARICFCVIGLNVSMLLWGVAQEFVMTNNYAVTEDGDVERMPSPLFLVFCNRLFSVMFAGALATALAQPLDLSRSCFAAGPAVSNLLASWCQYAAMSYISFPLQTTAKCAKLLPVLILSSLRGKRQTILDYAEAITITSGVVIFGMETENSQFEATKAGALLLCGMMMFDSITPHLQDALFQRFPDLMVIQATFIMSAVAATGAAVMLLCNGGLCNALIFLQRHPEAALHVLVLSLCSCLTQFLITYTIKHFGPVFFIIVVTMRQIISVCVSSVLFFHVISNLAWVAASLVFGTVLLRALWKLPGVAPANCGTSSLEDDDTESAVDSLALIWPERVREVLAQGTGLWRLVGCYVAIHVPLCFWAVSQEFMATHTFDGALFPSMVFLVAVNRVASVSFAVVVMRCRGIPTWTPAMKLTMLPGAANCVATIMQYQALVFIRFPEQTLMKTLKVIPVMLCGRLLKNRSYTTMDYVEASLITGLAVFFVWYFEAGTEDLREGTGTTPGVMLMMCYLATDSFTSNLEDFVYQRVKVDPVQMLLGTELCSGIVTWCVLFASGNFWPSVHFVLAQRRTIMPLGVLMLASTCGAYACTVTVRLFGPATFTLLMMSRQIVSLVISVVLFQHKVDWLSCLCLIVVAMLILTSSIRKSTVPSAA